MIARIFFIFIIGAGLSACSFGKQTFVRGNEIAVDQSYPLSRSVDSIVAPYKAELDREMNQVIAYAETDFINARPSGNLGNLVADIIYAKGASLLEEKPAICLVNFGGLRAPISKGNVTLGDIYKLMPFDNQLVLVKMPAASIYEIRDYLLQSGGEPISGFRIDGDRIYDASGAPWKEQDYWVITSDYLMNGGDRMSFFEKKLEVLSTGILFRDVLVDHFKANQRLKDLPEQRIVIR